MPPPRGYRKDLDPAIEGQETDDFKEFANKALDDIAPKRFKGIMTKSSEPASKSIPASPFSAAKSSLSSRGTRQVSRRKPQREIDAEEMDETNNSAQEENDESEVAYRKPRRQMPMQRNPLITW